MVTDSFVLVSGQACNWSASAHAENQFISFDASPFYSYWGWALYSFFHGYYPSCHQSINANSSSAASWLISFNHRG